MGMLWENPIILIQIYGMTFIISRCICYIEEESKAATGHHALHLKCGKLKFFYTLVLVNPRYLFVYELVFGFAIIE